MQAKSIKNYLLITIGSISLVLGILGIFLPILPTTPFLLLSSASYIRSSEKMYNWLINHRVFGPYIYNYITYKSIKKSTKIWALVFLWSTLTVSIWITSSIHLSIFLVAVGIGVSIHIFALKTLHEEKTDNLTASEEDLVVEESLLKESNESAL